ncbi:MAG: fibronectin type III-like domain-contianing protein, partial [Saprospiraceae bacterium]|nr:fibronectin type III-like domain-contianing protein [Saprospiraceae bacterium]
VMIPAGQSKEIRFTITDQELSFYRRDMSFGSEPGDFDLMIGGNSAELKSVRVTMTE